MATAEEIEAYRKAMDQAQVFGQGQYILLGKHVLKVLKLIEKRTMVGATAKESIVAEFEVLASTNPNMVVGETRSTVYRKDKQGWEGRFKAMAYALIGHDPELQPSEKVRKTYQDVSAALRYDEERKRLGWPENFMAGAIVNAEGMPGFIKNGANAGKEIVNIKWTPYAAPASTQGQVTT